MATAATAIHPAWEVLEASPAWERLTPSQRVWLVEFLATGDAYAATKCAYRCRSEQSANCLSYKVRKHPALVSALEYYRAHVQAMIYARLEKGK